MNSLGQNLSLRLGLMAAVAFVLAAGHPAPAVAAAPVASLDIVPADAAFYSAMLRNREQFDIIANSKAWDKLMKLPYVQMGLGLYMTQTADPDSVPGRIDAARRDPETKKSLEFLADIVSDEIFVYGGGNFNKTIELLQSISGAVRFSGVTAAMKGAGHSTPPREMEDAQASAVVHTLVNQIDKIEFPELVIGFKVKDKARAQDQLDRAELNAQTLLGMLPIFTDRFKRTKVAGHSYLTLTLDGEMIPWDPKVLEKIRSLADTPANGDKLIERLCKLKLVISLGLRDDFLLLSIGPSTDVLARLGSEATLRSRAELAAVGKFAEKRICSVGYLSEKLNRHISTTKEDIDDLLQTAKSTLPGLPVPDKLRDEIAKDAEALAADVKALVTKVGASSSVGFLTENGIEGYEYDWSEHPDVDASQPLELLKHIGGNPILAVVGRGKASPEGYDTVVRWLGVARRYFEEYGVPQIPPKEREQFEKVYGQLKPLAARLDKTTRDLLIPALADGQGGFVLDGKLTSRQFIKGMPMVEQPLTMLEPAIIIGVSDAAKLKKAFGEYYALADDLVEILKGIDEKNGIPKDFKIPRPRVFKLRLGDVYGYPLPAELGVDTRVMPNAGVGEKLAVLSISGRHTQRLLTETEPKMAGLALPTDQPRSTVAAFDFAVLIDAISPWVDLALEQSARHIDPKNAEMARLHAKTVIEVLKAFRGTVSETYLEGKVTVTHSRSEFHDIDD